MASGRISSFNWKSASIPFDVVPTAANEAPLLLSVSSSVSFDTTFNSDRTQLGVPTKHLSSSSRAETPKPGDVFSSKRFLNEEEEDASSLPISSPQNAAMAFASG